MKETLDAIKQGDWKLEAVRRDSSEFASGSNIVEQFEVAVTYRDGEYADFEFGASEKRADFDALWQKLKAEPSINDWLKNNVWADWAKTYYHYYWVNPEKLEIPESSDLGKELIPWRKMGFTFEWHRADCGGDPYEYNSWTDDNLCIMYAPNGEEIGSVDPWQLDRALKIVEVVANNDTIQLIH